MHFEGDTKVDMSMQGPAIRSLNEYKPGADDVKRTVSATSLPMSASATAIAAPLGIAPIGGTIHDYFPGGPIGSTIKYDPTEGVGADWLKQATLKKHAYTFLETAVKEMKDRAAQRDTQTVGAQAGGERSMAATVRAFNALTGKNLTEAEGWEFMILLKLVRGRQGAFRADDYVDAAAYAALLGECESTSR